MVGSMSFSSGARISVIPCFAVQSIAAPFLGCQQNSCWNGRQTEVDSPIMVQTIHLTSLAVSLLAGRVLPMALLYSSSHSCQPSTMVDRHIEGSVGSSLSFEPSSRCIYEGLWTLVILCPFGYLGQELQWYFLFTSAPTAPSTPRLSRVEEHEFPSSVPTSLATTTIATIPLSCQCFASTRITTLFLVHSRRSAFAIHFYSVPSSEGQSTSDRFQLRWLSTLLFHCLSSSDSLQELLLSFSFMFDTPSPIMPRQAILQMRQSFLFCCLLLRHITFNRWLQLRWLLPTLILFHCPFCGLFPELLMYFSFMSHTPSPVTSGQRLCGEHQLPQSLVPTTWLATTNSTSVPLFRPYLLIMVITSPVSPAPLFLVFEEHQLQQSVPTTLAPVTDTSTGLLSLQWFAFCTPTLLLVYVRYIFAIPFSSVSCSVGFKNFFGG
jgi:hypothetical protein